MAEDNEITKTRFTLIQRLKNQSDEEAWQHFTTTYERYIEVVLYKVGIPTNEITDLKQDILLKLWKKIPEFEYQPEKGKFRSWLWIMIRNTAYQHLSSKKSSDERTNRYFQAVDSSNPQASPELEDLAQREWKAFLTYQAMETLRGKFADRNIEMFEAFLKGTNKDSLAKKYDIQRNTVTRVINRIKERLIIEIANLRRELE